MRWISILCVWSGVGLESPSAHCSGYVIPVSMLYPAPGISIQTYSLPEFNYTQSDTFYQVKLQAELLAQFGSRQHAVIGKLDSVRTRIIYDSLWYLGQLVGVDTLREQSLWIRLLGQIKGSLPTTRFYYLDTLNFYSDPGLKILEQTYEPLIDTPFIAFFDTDMLGDAGIGPSDCSFFEPQAHVIIGGRIHKRGEEYYRMPGVSAPLDHFLAEAATISIPSVSNVDTLSRALRFGLGKTRVRKVSPAQNAGP